MTDTIKKSFCKFVTVCLVATMAFNARGFVQLSCTDEYDILEKLEDKIIHSDNNFILIIVTGLNGTCKYCNYLKSSQKKSGYSSTMSSHGCVEVTVDRCWDVIESFGMSGDTLPVVGLFPNPKDTRGNTFSWYSSHIIQNYPHTLFENQSDSDYFATSLLHWGMELYTNKVSFAEVVSNTVEEVQTNHSIKAEITTNLIIKVQPPTVIKEGSNTSFSLTVDSLHPSNKTVIVTCNNLLKTSFDTGTVNHLETNVVIYEEINEGFDVARTNNYKFICERSLLSINIPTEDILIKQMSSDIESVDGIWFVDHDGILNCIAYSDYTTGTITAQSNSTLTIIHKTNYGSEITTNGSYAGTASPQIALPVSTGDVIRIYSPSASKFSVFTY